MLTLISYGIWFKCFLFKMLNKIYVANIGIIIIVIIKTIAIKSQLRANAYRVNINQLLNKWFFSVLCYLEKGLLPCIVSREWAPQQYLDVVFGAVGFPTSLILPPNSLVVPSLPFPRGLCHLGLVGTAHWGNSQPQLSGASICAVQASFH